MDEDGVGHGQHRRDAGGRQAGGDAAHRAVGLTVLLRLFFLAYSRGLAGRQDDQGDLVAMEIGPQFVGRNEIALAIGFLEEEVAGVGRAIGVYGHFNSLLAEDFFHLGDARGAGGSDSVWQITFVVEYPVTVEVENVHRRLALVFEPFEERIECGRMEEFAGHAAAGFSVDGIQYSLGVGARVEKAGVAGAADDKQQA